MIQSALLEGLEDRFSRRVGRMDYSTMTMAAFLAQVERVERATGYFAAACCSERHALIDKPAHRLGAMLDDSLHDIAVAESNARVERIADVGVYAVLVI
jgi:hypothetical protein